jgi:hypothetical protein
MKIMDIVAKPIPLYAAVIGVAATTAGSYFFLQYRMGKEFDARLLQELDGVRLYYGTAKPYATPAEAVEALQPELDGQLEIETENYKSQSEEPKLKEVVRNVFTDADDMGDFDPEVEMAAREAGFPHVLLHDEFYESDLNAITLEYYEGDGVLADDKGQPILDVDALIGADSLQKFGHGSRDQHTVYVHNPDLDVNFEIVRNDGRFDEIVLGLKHVDDPRILRKMMRHED